jgi:hypothetical protein
MCLRPRVSDKKRSSSGAYFEASPRSSASFPARRLVAAAPIAGQRFDPDGPSTSSGGATSSLSSRPSVGVTTRLSHGPSTRPASRPDPGSATQRDSFPLPPVQKILSSRVEFSAFSTSQGKADTPLATVYRIYVAILGGYPLSLRNEIEHFWNKPRWRVADIPEPNIREKQQRAVLAAITYLLVKAFNRLINQGKPRNAPAIMSDKAMKKLESKPKVLERVPRWAESVEPLKEPLLIPDSGGAVPNNIEDADVDREMLKKNILTFTLPVLFA